MISYYKLTQYKDYFKQYIVLIMLQHDFWTVTKVYVILGFKHLENITKDRQASEETKSSILICCIFILFYILFQLCVELRDHLI